MLAHYGERELCVFKQKGLCGAPIRRNARQRHEFVPQQHFLLLSLPALSVQLIAIEQNALELLSGT